MPVSPDPVYSDIELPQRTAVAVIGGGIIGTSTALELAERVDVLHVVSRWTPMVRRNPSSVGKRIITLRRFSSPIVERGRSA